ncbi:response regulator [Chitinivorax sp. B]|uniref:hybrid sensor histidine kinase/response regulator n=1 Tax=Chitinivorax sp. B TaxID=2502235 RepID=UPI0010F78A3F|nr:response regulator [Chitinivorax sp. B]
MAEDQAQFMRRLLSTFRAEADEHVAAMDDLLLMLAHTEPGPQANGLVETLFREAHSLKGAARAVDQSAIETICRDMESLLSLVKQGQLDWSAATHSQLQLWVEDMSHLLSTQVIPQPVSVVPAAVPARRVEVSPYHLPANDTVRISSTRLSDMLAQVEDLAVLKQGVAYLADEMTDLCREVAGLRNSWLTGVRGLRSMRRAMMAGSVQTAGAKLVDKLTDIFERDAIQVQNVESRMLRLLRQTQQDRHTTVGMVDGMMSEMKHVLLQPFSALLELLPKLAYDQARDTGKSVDIDIKGAEIEIDRRILEQLKDPLIHLVRNCIDHGLEMPEARERQGKPPTGGLRIEVTPKDAGKVELLVADDGAGVKLDQVRSAAIRHGLLTEADHPDDSTLLDLLFESGVSTSQMVTDISGRGLGMAIVREKVEKLGGEITVSSQSGQGTCFRLLLPATLATFRGLLVEVGVAAFVLPVASVSQVLRIVPQFIRSVEGRDSLEWQGVILALVWLADVLGLPREPVEEGRHVSLVIVTWQGRQLAFAVDRVVGDQEVLVKGLGPQLKRVTYLSGATVLGSGRVVPILSIGDLMKGAVGLTPKQPATGQMPQGARQPTILIAEDSITSRSLLKNILEMAGYTVLPAVDGVDALAQLHDNQVDLVVSDVEMPRLDGLGLTARIRSAPATRDLPVILVTALDAKEDRERGVDAGANAYIVKSGFDQEGLLDVIRRLI